MCFFTFRFFAWLADAVNNAAGYGFAGMDESGKPSWDLISNINIFGIEVPPSITRQFDAIQNSGVLNKTSQANNEPIKTKQIPAAAVLRLFGDTPSDTLSVWFS